MPYLPFPDLTFLSRTVSHYCLLQVMLCHWFARYCQTDGYLTNSPKKDLAVVLEFHDIGCCITQEPLNGKTSFQSHIVEQYKSYRMVVESLGSIQGNHKNVPLFVRHTFRAFVDSMHKMFPPELVNVTGLWDLNETRSRRVALSSGLYPES